MSVNNQIPVICLVGYHDSGKTTLGVKIVRHLKKAGLTVGVIKSTKEEGISFDTPGTDTHNYAASGADQVALIAPDQMVIQARRPDKGLPALAQTFFGEVDILIAEGFKNTPAIPKIEVNRDGETFLYPQLDNVIAVISDRTLTGIRHFTPQEPEQIALFIRNTLL